MDREWRVCFPAVAASVGCRGARCERSSYLFISSPKWTVELWKRDRGAKTRAKRELLETWGLDGNLGSWILALRLPSVSRLGTPVAVCTSAYAAGASGRCTHRSTADAGRSLVFFFRCWRPFCSRVRG